MYYCIIAFQKLKIELTIYRSTLYHNQINANFNTLHQSSCRNWHLATLKQFFNEIVFC